MSSSEPYGSHTLAIHRYSEVMSFHVEAFKPQTLAYHSKFEYIAHFAHVCAVQELHQNSHDMSCVTGAFITRP